MIRAKQAYSFGENRPERRHRTSWVTGLPDPVGEIMADSEGFRVVWAKDLKTQLQQGFQLADRSGQVTLFASPSSESVPGAQGIWMRWSIDLRSDLV